MALIILNAMWFFNYESSCLYFLGKEEKFKISIYMGF